MFKFADSDIKASSKALKSHEEELNRALKIAVPGLMTEASIQPGQSAILASLMTDDRYNAATGTSAASNANRGTHKPLVVADAFNVSVLIGPTLSFLDRAQLVMPDGLISDNIEEEGVDNSFGGFLDDFVLRTFLPQLEAKVTSVFHQAVGGEQQPLSFVCSSDDDTDLMSFQVSMPFKRIQITRGYRMYRSSRYAIYFASFCCSVWPYRTADMLLTRLLLLPSASRCRT